MVTDIAIEGADDRGVTFLHLGLYKVATYSPMVWQRTIYQAIIPDLTPEAKEVLDDEAYADYDISQIEVVEHHRLRCIVVQMVNYIDSVINVTVTDSESNSKTD